LPTDSAPTAYSEPAGTSDAVTAITGRRLAAVYAVLVAAVLFPMFAVEVVPLADLPNHMARIHVLAHIDEDPALAAHYRVNWAMQPNLAVDLLLRPLAEQFPALELGRWFAALTVLTLVGGTLALHRVLHGRLGLWPAAALLFVYNHALIWGFLNFLFGVGVALGLLAAWIATDGRAGWRRIVAFSLACIGLYFVHLMSLGLYATMVGAWELGRLAGAEGGRRLLRTWAPAGLQFIPAALLFLATLPQSPGPSEFEWGTAAMRLRGFWSPVLTNVGPTDALVGVAIVAILLCGLAFDWFRPAPGARLPLLCLAGLALVAPFWTYGRFGGVWGLDVRLWIAAALVAVGGLHFTGSVRTAHVLGTVGLVLLSLRLYQIQDHWRIYDGQIREFRGAAKVIEPGSRVLHVQERSQPTAGDPGSFPEFYNHLSTFLVIDRSAFVPLLFTDPRKQPVVAAPINDAIDTPVGWPLTRGELRAWADPSVFDWFDGETEVGDQRRYGFMWQDRFDYVVVVHQPDRAPGNPLPALLEPLVGGSYFTIYRVVQRACTGDYPDTCRALRLDGHDWALPKGE